MKARTGSGWHFFVDRGGTFTDIVALAPDGRLVTHKLLSQNEAQYRDAALAGIERLRASDALGSEPLASVKIGTTIGTNALLERSGAPTVLVITRGLGDLLRIGTQQRPDIFALNIERPEMLYAAVIEADERIAADGAIVRSLDGDRLERDLAEARAAGSVSVAIALANSYRESCHEEQAAALARACGFEHVSISSRINPEIKLLERAETAVVDAYLTPVLDAYKASLDAGLAGELPDDGLWFMQSHGGLIDAAGFRGCDSVLSGPAGGVVGMATTAGDAGFDQVVGFDMGGTSTDVSVYAGAYERATVTRVAGLRLARPMLKIHTVAAGGGSILRFHQGRLRVGPESAGAYPGPACYRNGGPLTLTDANVLLGRIQADHFPRVFGPGCNESIDVAAVESGFAELSLAVAREQGLALTPIELASGFQRIAIANMARAIEQISVQRGHDVTRFALACFGGAGGQHACGVADALGIETIIVHPLSGVLSAYGIGIAERRSIASAGVHAELDDRSIAIARAELARLQGDLAAEFAVEPSIEARLHLGAAGTDTLLAVPFRADSTQADLEAAFAALHRQRFGFDATSERLIAQSLEVEAIAAIAQPVLPHLEAAAPGEAVGSRSIWFRDRWLDTPVYRRATLAAGQSLAGPALIAEDNATIVVEPAWKLQVDAAGNLIIERQRRRSQSERVDTKVDPIMLEIFGNKFMQVAEQMGTVLEQTAQSVNIKERLDYSCALFDRGGELVANAPHVPVHLGSMDDSVRQVIESASGMRPGDAYMLNAPYRGGTHLPDITVVMPVFIGADDRPEFYVASRAHHADIGGITPGSMPASSHTIDEEGIVIEVMPVLRDGRLLTTEILAVLAAGSHPARNPSQNLADLKAQLAACAKGRSELEQLLRRYGDSVVHAYMGHVRANAEACTRNALRGLSGGKFSVTMDSGERIAVAIAIEPDLGTARIDFAGTSGVSPRNLNAPRSVVRAVVLYVLRTLIEDDIPLNAGCLVPVDIVIPKPSLLSPEPPAAVAGGNVETSQCIADALLGAFGAVAAAQGTMNNFSFGNERYQYYETICGGAGAGPGFAGASAVHTHMTNSRLTDIEVLEQRFPVRVARFAIRTGSGGSGTWRGGDGIVRELEFLEPMHVSVLANRRREQPFGLAGGGPGATGRDTIIRLDGSRESLPASGECNLEAGDRIVIETPGGGGYGADERNPAS